MPIQATCPGCRNTLKVADTARGKQVRCGIKNEAVTSINQFQAEIDKAAAEQKRKQEENQKRIENQLKQNNPDPNPPAGRNQPSNQNPNDVRTPRRSRPKAKSSSRWP